MKLTLKLKLQKCLNLLLVPCCFLALNGCASGPQQLIISPQNTANFSNIYGKISANIKSTDMRASSHIVQILRADKAAELISSATPIATVVEKSLNNIFSQQGLTITNAESQVNISIFIDTAMISVEQSLIKYQANNSIGLRLKIRNADKTLTKSFTSHGKSNGPLNADLAVLERDFNQQLTKLLNQISTDTEIQTFIAH